MEATWKRRWTKLGSHHGFNSSPRGPAGSWSSSTPAASARSTASRRFSRGSLCAWKAENLVLWMLVPSSHIDFLSKFHLQVRNWENWETWHIKRWRSEKGQKSRRPTSWAQNSTKYSYTPKNCCFIMCSSWRKNLSYVGLPHKSDQPACERTLMMIPIICPMIATCFNNDFSAGRPCYEKTGWFVWASNLQLFVYNNGVFVYNNGVTIRWQSVSQSFVWWEMDAKRSI